MNVRFRNIAIVVFIVLGLVLAASYFSPSSASFRSSLQSFFASLLGLEGDKKETKPGGFVTILNGGGGGNSKLLALSEEKRGEFESFQALSKYTELIVLAEVESKTYKTGKNKKGPNPDQIDQVWTIYTLKVYETFKGKPEPEITIQHSGGKFGDGRWAGTEDMPVLQEGQKYILFLAKKGAYSPFAGWSEGVYPLLKDETGKLVFTGYSGRQFVDFRGGRMRTKNAPIEASKFINSIKTAFRLENISGEQTNLSGTIAHNLTTPENYREQQNRLFGIIDCAGARWVHPNIEVITNYSYQAPNSRYLLLEEAANDWSSFIPNTASISLLREDDNLYDPATYDEDRGEWSSNFYDGYGFIGEMNESHELFGNLSAFIYCGGQGSTITAATIAVRKDYPWLESVQLEDVERRANYFFGSNSYGQVVRHEFGHMFDFRHGDMGENYMSVMAKSNPLAKIWDFDRYQLKIKYPDTPNYKNIYSSNWKVKCCFGDYSWLEPVAELPDNAWPVGVPFNVEYNFGYYGTNEPEDFYVGIYFVPVPEGGQWDANESNWTKLGESRAFVNLNYPEAIIGLMNVTLPNELAGQQGAIMVFADNHNEVTEADENDNGNRWPRLGNTLTNVQGGWLYLDVADDYGGSYNSVQLTVDNYGPPAQVDLVYSETPYLGDPHWFDDPNTIHISIPDFPDDYQAGEKHYIDNIGFQNDKQYYIMMREIRNGYSEWEEEYGGVVDTHACVIEVDSPNGDEHFFARDPINIKWNRQGRCRSLAMIELENYTDRIITYETTNDGSYVWKESDQINGWEEGYKIIVIGLETPASDMSDAVFNIDTPKPFAARNPSFEWDYGVDYFPAYNFDNRTVGDLLPDGWTQSSWPAFIDNTNKHGGLNSVFIAKGSDNGFHAYTSEDLPVMTNHLYRISGWVKTACWDSDCFGTITSQCLKSDHSPKWTNCGLNIPDEKLIKITGTQDWRRLSYNVMADNPQAAYLQLLCYNSPRPSDTRGTGIVWCDDMKVEDISDGGKSLPYSEVGEESQLKQNLPSTQSTNPFKETFSPLLKILPFLNN